MLQQTFIVLHHFFYCSGSTQLQEKTLEENRKVMC